MYEIYIHYIQEKHGEVFYTPRLGRLKEKIGPSYKNELNKIMIATYSFFIQLTCLFPLSVLVYNSPSIAFIVGVGTILSHMK